MFIMEVGTFTVRYVLHVAWPFVVTPWAEEACLGKRRLSEPLPHVAAISYPKGVCSVSCKLREHELTACRVPGLEGPRSGPTLPVGDPQKCDDVSRVLAPGVSIRWRRVSSDPFSARSRVEHSAAFLRLHWAAALGPAADGSGHVLARRQQCTCGVPNRGKERGGGYK